MLKNEKKNNLFAHTILNANVFCTHAHVEWQYYQKSHKHRRIIMCWTCWTPFVRIAISILLRVHTAFTIRNELLFFYIALCFSNTRRLWILDTFLFLLFLFFSSLCTTSVLLFFDFRYFACDSSNGLCFVFPLKIFPFRLMPTVCEKGDVEKHCSAMGHE